MEILFLKIIWSGCFQCTLFGYFLNSIGNFLKELDKKS